MSITLQIIQHVPFEGPANIEKWARENNCNLQYCRIYEGDSFPATDTYDLLIVMGGPMGVYSTKDYPWVDEELRYIKNAIEDNKAVLGICLGAQFIAKALGSNVYRGPYKEIGWWPLNFSKRLPEKFMEIFPSELMTFHWHGDTFDIPGGAVLLGSTEGVPNQGFIFGEKVIALQFHLEMNTTSMEGMIKHCADDIDQGNYIQTPSDLTNGLMHESKNYLVLNNILTYLSGRFH